MKVECPLLALSGHSSGADQSPLLGGKADMALVTQSGPCTLREQHNTAKLNALPHVFCHLDMVTSQSDDKSPLANMIFFAGEEHHAHCYLRSCGHGWERRCGGWTNRGHIGQPAPH
jgi:hypothetical protein